MGLLNFLRKLFGGSGADVLTSPTHQVRSRPVTLESFRYQPREFSSEGRLTDEPPYQFARRFYETGKYLDLSEDTSSSQLDRYDLPLFSTPVELAEWLNIGAGQLAWLTHRYQEQCRPDQLQRAHYHFHWIKKRSGGVRLIESPKQILKQVQKRILEEILNNLPAHPAAHGFVKNCSILTNAQPHVGKRVLLKFDLENFYAGISFSRVVAILCRFGYCREAAIWLARLTTSALPRMMPFPKEGSANALNPYQRRHLPQGAPTSPALANLSAFALDVRCQGLATSFGGSYTRYADDLTFSGSEQFLRALPVFIPLVKKIIRNERFRLNVNKQKVIRSNQCQQVTGVVVNERTNISRREYDRLKATLHNCIHSGATSQNRDSHPDFAAHLRGKISHIQQLNRHRGSKLKELYQQINW